MAREIGQALASRLDRLVRGKRRRSREEPRRLARRDYVNPEVVLIAKIDDARLVLPWEAGSRAAVAASPAEGGYARLQRARALLRVKKDKESLVGVRGSPFSSPEVVDEYGVPLSFYAVAPLLEAGSMHGRSPRADRTAASVRSLALSRGPLSDEGPRRADHRGSSRRLRDRHPGGAEDHLRKILAQIQTMEQALSLKEDFPRLGLEPLPGPNSSKANLSGYPTGRSPGWWVCVPARSPEERHALVAVDFLAFFIRPRFGCEYFAAKFPGTSSS